ncbi:MAG: TolC family protein [Sulfurimonas sp.]|nr:TolC family protein [Sulfurimonas sp.]
MKGLKTLNLLLVLCSITYASEELTQPLDRYISDIKKDKFNYLYKQNEVDGAKLRDSWIAPLKLNYIYTKKNSYDRDQEQKSASIKMDQTIFQSGGIYFGIKYANYSKKYANLTVDMQKRKLVKDAISILMQIKQTDLKIKKQKLQIKNSEISLAQKKEQYLNGQLDSGFLDNAIIERNFVIQSLYDIQTSKERLISKFKTISDLKYENLAIPKLDKLELKQFLNHNIILDISNSDMEKLRYFSNITVAKYLPKVSFIAGYNWQGESLLGGSFQSPETTFYDYGLKVSMPIDFSTFNDIESTKVQYLKSKIEVEDKKIELIAIYEQVMQNLKNYEKKKLLSLENKEIYEKLLKDTKELFGAGYKTQYDVDLLENSVAIAEIDYKTFEIDKQLELLTLYEMYKND